MNKTQIEWVKNPDGTQGYTWNPITGCLNGCPYCYARKLANTRLRERYLANTHYWIPKEHEYRWMDMIIKGKDIPPDTDPFYPRFWEDRLHDLPTLKLRSGRFSGAARNALREKQRKGIFVCDMADLFGIGVPEEWTRAVLSQCNKFWHHRFYLLTKQPQNLIKWSPFPENCWVGVTATDRHFANQAQKAMLEVEAKVKYLSIEPCLDSIPWELLLGYNWVIIGALTLTLEDYNNSNYALRRGLKLKRWGNKWTVQPDIEWVREILEACDKAGIPVFLKDNLNPMFAENDCKLFEEHRDTLFTFKDFKSDGKTRWHLRQEMPE